MAISINQINKAWGKHQVVNNVSLRFERSNFISLIGPNGAGKSTLLSLIGHIYPADNGEILLDNQDLNKFSDNDIAKKISFLRQHNQVGLRINIEELVAFGRFPYSGGKLTDTDQKYISSAIEYLGLEDIRHKYLDEISGGQRQRAFIAMVLAQDTDFILLDEPLNNLDMRYSKEIMTILKRLVREKDKAIIVVLHDINFAAKYSDHIIALKNGTVVEEGTADYIMQESVLERIYDIQIPIHQIGNQKVALYF